MKNSVLLFVCASMVMPALLYAQTKPGNPAKAAPKPATSTFDLTGRWSGASADGEKIILIFHKNKSLTYVVDEDTLGAPFLVEDGDTLLHTSYTADLAKKPCWLDIIQKDADTGEEHERLKGILEFVTPNKIRLYLPPDDLDKRLPGFVPEIADEIYTLTRK